MSWWKNLLESRRLQPQTVSPIEPHGGHPVDMSALLTEWLEAAFRTSEGAEEREAEVLARLRADPERAITEITAVYERVPEGDYALRWALIYGAGQLETQASLDFLERVLRDPIPPERSHDIHHLSTVAEETALRCRAIDGIASLAVAPNDRASSTLLNQLAHPSFTVRVMACLALRELPDRPVSDEDIGRRLPKDEADRVLAIRRAQIEELVTLVEGGIRGAVPRPPGGEYGTALPEFGDRRPPRVGR